MNINWKIRLMNKNFWISMIPMVMLFVQLVASLCGVELNLSGMQEKILSIVNVLFGMLALIGIANDPTTATFNDSEKAMTYTHPKER